jgi:general secretion pathway protein H
MKPIFPPKISNQSVKTRLLANPRGLTLMEIMIVLVIMAAVAALGVPRMLGTGTQLRTTMRQLSVISRRLHHMARMNKKTYRLVIQLGDGQEQTFWVESSERNVALLSDEQIKEEDEKLRNLDEEERPKSNFTLDTTVLKKPQTLPNKMYFEDVELSTRNSVISSGRAYIHYLPQGFVEEAAIHITDKKEIHWSLIVHPLTGQGDVVSKYLSVKDLRAK